MVGFLQGFNKLSLKGKLITSFIGLIIFPLIFLSIFSSNLYLQEIQDTVIKSAVQSNEQVIKNLDSFLGLLSKLTEYPISDTSIREILKKDYSKAEYPDYEKARDFDIAKGLLYNNIKVYSDMIDSIFLYRADTYEIRGRTPTDSLNSNYAPSNEKWLTDITNLNGGYSVIGIHRDIQTIPGGNYVITAGRSIIEPGTGNNLGTIIINVRVEDLNKLWMDSTLTPNTKFFLVDEKDNIIFSSDKDLINTSIHRVIEGNADFDSFNNKEININGQKYYLMTSVSDMSNWKVVMLVPREELFSFFGKMYGMTALTALVIIIVSVIIAIMIATGVARPLYKLNGAMREVARGNFDAEIEVGGSGEVREISLTVQKMIREIKTLIGKIYKEEEEKRVAEMNALQSQINPHFLYNTLNAIKWMANIQGASGIENVLNTLSSMFAFTAKSSCDFVPIREEIEFVQNYLKILNIRYYNKFTVDFDIDENVYEYKTLKFLLQPVIENAVFHGIEGVERKGRIRIAIYHSEGKVFFKVEDNGKGITKEVLDRIFSEEGENVHKKFNSIGIPNIQKRIRLHFGEEYGLSIQSVSNRGTTVTIVIPAMHIGN
jgi:two-component system sensor histidine kinase YesM